MQNPACHLPGGTHAHDRMHSDKIEVIRRHHVPEDFFPAIWGSKFLGESVDADEVFENAIVLADGVVVGPGKIEKSRLAGSISRHNGPQFIRTEHRSRAQKL